MVNTNAVAVVMVEVNKLIDKLELETSILQKSDITFLGNYQAKLASARTTRTQDNRFIEIFSRWMRIRGPKV